ncbi:Ribosome recycling factor domain containing protein [Naviculisporaceae sp. PSN 640]
MKSLQVANALLRSGASTCNALSRSAPLLSSSRIASSSRNNSQLLRATHGLPTITTSRPFSHTSAQYKKKNKHNKELEQEDVKERRASRNTPPKSEREGASSPARPEASSSSSASGPIDPDRPFPDPEQPYDFADLTYTFDKTEAHHTSELSKLRAALSGGRSTLTAEQIGAIPVVPDRKNAPHTSYPLRELATIAPLGGRKFSILAFEQSSVKPILSAVQTSPDFNQQPQKSEENPLELTITAEPERAEQLQKRVKDMCLAWREKIRDVTHKRESMHKKWLAAGMILKDDVRKLKEKMQKMQDERMKVVQTKEKDVLGAIAKR